MVALQIQNLRQAGRDGDLVVSDGRQIKFVGPKGDTRILTEWPERSLHFYRGEKLIFQIHDGFVVVPTCPSDTHMMPFGAICKDVQDGKLLVRASSVKTGP